MISADQPRVIEAAAPQESRVSSAAAKKILFVARTAEYGGTEKHLLRTVRGLRGSGVRISIFNLGPDLFTERLDTEDSARVMVASEPMSFWDWLRLFRRVRPDVVVFSCSWIGNFPWFATVAASLAGARSYSIQHLFPPPARRVEGTSLRSRVRRLVGGRARYLMGLRLPASFWHRTICVSNPVRDSLVRDYRFPQNKTITIHNGVSVSEFAPRENAGAAVRTMLGVGSDEFLLVCTARLSEQKQIDILVEAIARVVRDGVTCKCVVVGDGPLRQQLSELASRLGLSGHVFFVGFHEDVRPYLHAGSAFVLTSSVEGLPLALLEAMSCGLPSIVTDVGGNTDAITHQVDGLVVPPGSVEAIADAIADLATQPQRRAEMSRMARRRACAAFDIEKSISEIKNVILN